MAALPAATLLPPHAARGATGPASAAMTEARAVRAASAKSAVLRVVTARSAALRAMTGLHAVKGATAPASAAMTEARAVRVVSAKSVARAVTAPSGTFQIVRHAATLTARHSARPLHQKANSRVGGAAFAPTAPPPA